MKNRLLATLLIFVAIPLGANDVTPSQQTKAELITSLKALKTYMHHILLNLSKECEIFENEYGGLLYKETTAICQGLYEIISKKMDLDLDCSFNYTYEKQLEYLKKQNQKAIYYDLMGNGLCIARILYHANGLSINQEQLIKSIFIRHGKDASKPFRDLLNDFFRTKNNWEISSAIDTTRNINILLPKIDAKIAELETQL